MSIEAIKEQARSHEQSEEWSPALDLYLQAIRELGETDQSDISLYNRVGDLETRLGKSREAADHYLIAVGLYVEAELPNNAIAVCKKVIRNVPERADVHLRMGQIRASQGFLTDARHSFLTYAEHKQKAGDMEEAFRALIEFADLAPDDTEIRLSLAGQLHSHDRTDEAVDQLLQARACMILANRGEEAAEVEARIAELAPDLEFPDAHQVRSAAPASSGAVGADEGLALEDVAATAGLDSDAEASVSDGMDGFETTNLTAENEGEGSVEDSLADALSVLDDSDNTENDLADAHMDVAGDGETAAGALGQGNALDTDALGDLEDLAAGFADLSGEPVDLVEPPADPLDDLAALASGLEGQVAELGELNDDVETEALSGNDDSVSAALDALDDLASALDSVSEDTADACSTGEVVDDCSDTGLSNDADSDLNGTVEDTDDLPFMAFDAEAEVETESDASDALSSATDDSPQFDGGEDIPGGGATTGRAMESELSQSSNFPSVSGDNQPSADEMSPAATAVKQGPAAPQGSPENLMQQGIAAMHAGQAEEAVPLLEQAYEGLAASENFELAVQVLQELITHVPQEIEYRQRMVECAFQADDSSVLSQAYVELARCLNLNNEAVKAKAVFQQVLSIDPGNEEALSGVGTDVAEPTSKADEVAASEDYVDLGALIFDDEEEEKTTRWYVEMQDPTGDDEADFAQMLAQFKSKVAEHIEADDVRAHYDLGTAYREMGLVDEAIAEFQQALRAAGDHLPTFEVLGQCFMEKGQYEVAIRSMTRALDVNFEVEDELLGIYYYLGLAHEELGDSQSATEFYERIFSLDINFQDVTERLRALR